MNKRIDLHRTQSDLGKINSAPSVKLNFGASHLASFPNSCGSGMCMKSSLESLVDVEGQKWFNKPRCLSFKHHVRKAGLKSAEAKLKTVLEATAPPLAKSIRWHFDILGFISKDKAG